ncbi:hypothetical protein DHEL01_v205963 [Diaporthe helianthi]|uniref:Kelch repeat protein n=1 Tax=Diaporthe helianthi TaxID=158607 RepID=A0A2P5HZF2_DIAHE|nr:hypothetical protein DHEL01_v205963 [Diaporthe helianthi]
MYTASIFAFLGLITCGLSKIVDGTWKTLAEIPYNVRQEHFVVSLNNQTIYIMGGIIPTNPAQPNITTTINIVQAYDIPSDTWSNKSSAPLPLNHMNVAVVDGKIYSLGGLEVLPDAWHGVGNIAVYDPQKDVWTNLTTTLPNNTYRGASVTAVKDDVIWMAGGVRLLVPGVGGYHVSTYNVTAYNVTSGSFLDLPPAAASLPEARDHGVGGIVGNRLFYTGGRINGQPNMRNTTFYLDLDDLETGWVTTESHMPTARAGSFFAIQDDTLWTFGGEVKYNSTDGLGTWHEVEVLNTTSLEWTSLNPMKVPRHGCNGVVVDGVIYFPGGGLRNNAWPTNYTDAYILPSLSSTS